MLTSKYCKNSPIWILELTVIMENAVQNKSGVQKEYNKFNENWTFKQQSKQ